MLIKGQSDIEIFITDGGYICLKQRQESEEQLISIAPAYSNKVASAITSLQDFAQKKFEKSPPIED